MHITEVVRALAVLGFKRNPPAETVVFDPAGTGLEATTVQEAVVELAADIEAALAAING